MEIRQRSLSYPQDEGLYHFSNEHDACGVGMVVDLNGKPCHENVLRGLTVLKRLQHRGAAGSDALSGDGAGLLCPIPHEFFQCQLEGILPEPGSYALAMMFNGVGEEAVLESVIEAEGCRILAWRNVPTDPSQLGEQARERMREPPDAAVAFTMLEALLCGRVQAGHCSSQDRTAEPFIKLTECMVLRTARFRGSRHPHRHNHAGQMSQSAMRTKLRPPIS